MQKQHIDRVTIIGWAMVLMPVLTMWHEIGGHAAMCALQGGRVQEIGAFYVQCRGLTGTPEILVACAGAGVNVILAVIAFFMWRRARTDISRLVLWLVWVTQGFVAAGYPAFSGITGTGDFGVGRGGALAGHGLPAGIGYLEAFVGIGAYALLVRTAARTLTTLLGDGLASLPARLEVTRTYYISAGVAALLVGALNPIGVFVTIMSAMASTFGGLAGLFRVGSKVSASGSDRPFQFPRNKTVVVVGMAIFVAFAAVLGPGWHPAR